MNRFARRTLLNGLMIFGLAINTCNAMSIEERVMTSFSSPAIFNQEVSNALAAANTADRQNAYYSAIQNARTSGMGAVLVAQQNLILAVQSAIAENQGNEQLVEALHRCLAQLQAQSNVEAYLNAYATVPTTMDSSEADANAAAITMGNYGGTVSSVQQNLIASAYEQEARKNAAIQYIDTVAQYDVPLLPDVPDDTPASIYSVSSNDMAYFINAGQYSDVSVGQQYGVSNGTNMIGYVEIVYVAPTYSISVPVNSFGVTAGSRVMGAVARKYPRQISSS